MARRIFIVLAFILAIDLMIPVVNALSPFSVDYTTQPSNSASLGATKIIGDVGCTPPASGNLSCSVSVGGTGSSTGVLGPVVNTILVFGNFFYAAGFLGQLSGGIVIPSYYLTQWFGGAGIADGLALFVIAFQGLIYLAYADGIVYIISGRDILG
jgi:hypothetical protein